MSDETTLLPCPMCGAVWPSIQVRWIGFTHTHNGAFSAGYRGECCDCGLITRAFNDEAEAIAAWNSRADYHGYEQAAIEAWESIKAWNSRAERTCECVAEYAESPIDGKKIVLHRCSACHELMRPHMRYCPNCGARRVGE